MANTLRSWHRIHVNKMISTVIERGNPGEFSVGANPENGAAAFTMMTGTLSGAKLIADRAALCVPNCNCDPWFPEGD